MEEKSSQEWSSLQQKERARMVFSARPCRLSWNKRGMALLMKGRELTRIALAQCAHSFCQSRLQRYNKVHGYNEAWAHLSLNWISTLTCGVLALLRSFVLVMIVIVVMVLLQESSVILWRGNKSLFFFLFPIFQYADRCLQNLAYLHMTPGTQLSPEKQERCSILRTAERVYGKTVRLLLAHNNKMIIFYPFFNSLLCLWCAPMSQHLKVDARVVTVPLLGGW